MYHVDNKTGVATMPDIPPSESTVPQWFTEGGPGEEPTIPGSTTWNIWQAELLNILAASEVVPDKFKLNQIAESIGLLIARGIEDADLSPNGHTHPGTLPAPIALAGEDLNTLVTPNVYRQDSDANATLELNYPEAKSGSLIVTGGAGSQQRYHVYNTSRIYTRAQYDVNAFTPWELTYNTANKPSPDDIGAAHSSHTHDWGQVGAPARVAGGYGEQFPPGDHGPLLSQSGFFNNSGGLGAYGDPFPSEWAYLFHNSHSNPSGFCGTLAMNFGGTKLRYSAISDGGSAGWKIIFTQDEPPQIGNIPGLQGALDGKAPAAHGHNMDQVDRLSPGNGGGASSLAVYMAGKTLYHVCAILRGRAVWITAHVSDTTVTFTNRGGEGADRDYDGVLSASFDGATLSIWIAQTFESIWAVYY